MNAWANDELGIVAAHRFVRHGGILGAAFLVQHTYQVARECHCSIAVLATIELTS